MPTQGRVSDDKWSGRVGFEVHCGENMLQLMTEMNGNAREGSSAGRESYATERDRDAVIINAARGALKRGIRGKGSRRERVLEHVEEYGEA